jgi:hypothetical protein
MIASRLPDGDDTAIPRFSDTEAIIEIFLEEELREWAFARPRPTVTIEQALSSAKSGDAADLVRIVEAMMTKRKRGRPKMAASARFDASPIHQIASMVQLTESILKSWYPDRLLLRDIRPTAYAVVSAMLRRELTDETADMLDNFLDRSKRNRRRIA